jgi:anti-sigma-K factor RskA
MTDAPTDRSALALEHAMGLLDGAEASEALRLVSSDPAFAADVAGWSARLAGLDATAAPVAPPPDLWARIERALDAPAPLARVTRPTRTQNTRSVWSSLPAWRIATATAAAAALALLVWTVAFRPAPTPVLVAVLLSDSDRPGAVVNVLPDGRTYLVRIPEQVGHLFRNEVGR